MRLLGTTTLTLGDPQLDVTVRSGPEPEGRRMDGPQVHGFLRPDGRQVVIAWDRAGPVVLDLRLPRAGRTARSFALDGTSTSLSGLAGRALRGLAIGAGEVRVVEVDP